METELKEIIGTKVEKIFLNKNYLKFITNKGDFVYSVSGECCSSSYFYDFYGVKNLLENGPIINVKQVELTKDDKSYIACNPQDRGKSRFDDYIECYGYQITTENNEFGEMTSCFSFRNASNGFYGGHITQIYPKNEKHYIQYNTPILEEMPELIEIKDDIIEVK